MNRLAPALPLALAVALFAACSPNETPIPERAPYETETQNALACLPNLDKQISALEASPSFGASANYLVSPKGLTRAIDLDGKDNGDGTRLWDYSTDDATDRSVRIAPVPIEGKWYAPSFDNSNAFVTPLDAAGTQENILVIDGDVLKLLGVASAEENGPNGKTLFVYDPPIDFYKFPLQVGSKYESKGVVRNGFFQNIPYAGEDTYAVEVDGIGEVRLPDLIATQVLRVRITVTVAPAAGVVTTTQQTSFLTECLGEITRVQSQPNEQNRNFTEAAEVRRLGLFP